MKERKEKKPQTCLLSCESKPTWSNTYSYKNIVKESEVRFNRSQIAGIGLQKYIHSNSLK